MTIDRKAVRAVTATTWFVAATTSAHAISQLWRLPTLGFDLRFYWRGAAAVAKGVSPYEIHGFVYPPSAAALLFPLRWMSWELARHAGLIAIALALAATILVSARLFGRAWFGFTAALCCAIAPLTVPVRKEYLLENLGALVALGLTVFLLLAIRERWEIAGVVLGLTLCLKPMLVPLVAVPLLWGRWRASAAAVATAALANVIAWGIVASPQRFFTTALPYLSKYHGPQFDRYNLALLAIGRQLHVPSILTLGARVLLGILGLTAAVIAARRLKDRAVGIIVASELVLLVTFVCGSYSEIHYLLALVPLYVAILVRGSPSMRPAAMVGIVATLAPRIPFGLGLRAEAADTVQRGLGMALLLVGISATVLMRGIRQRGSDL